MSRRLARLERVLERVAAGTSTPGDAERLRVALTINGRDVGELPEDLGPETVKLARRIQALPPDAIYGIILVKAKGGWSWCVEERGKAEG